MYIYHAFINALSAHMIHINLNVIFYTHAEHSSTKTIYIKYYTKKKKKKKTYTYARSRARAHTHTHTHTPPPPPPNTHTMTVAEIGY